ncbi:MAG: SDR family NAD(P)-dependent oxidoreductase [Novosphingobium sp.]
MGLSGRVAVVTGAGSGIGKAMALRLARDGAAVGVWDWAGEAAERTAAEITAAGGQAIACHADCSARDDIAAAAARTREALGPILILVNNAGIAAFTPVLDITDEIWDRILAVNLKGPFLCTQAILPDMLAAGWGRIVNISSSSFQLGSSQMAHYASSKGGLVGLTRALAIELAMTGVTVNTIPPSFCDTPMLADAPVDHDAYARTHVPMQRMSKPEELAATCAFLVSDDAGFMTGQTISVNGGRYFGN